MIRYKSNLTADARGDAKPNVVPCDVNGYVDFQIAWCHVFDVTCMAVRLSRAMVS